MSGPKKFINLLMIGMLAFVFILIYPAQFEVMDLLQSANTTWTTANTTLAVADPHGEVVANWFPFLIFLAFMGGLVYAANHIIRRGQNR